MLKLILGGAGTGKTHLITEMIKKDIAEGKRAVLLVPEQETVARERAMLSHLPPSAQLSFEVLNFSRLANSVFRKYGGLTYSYVSAPVKSLAMWNTLRQLSPLLSEYGRQSGDASFSTLMLSQIEEFKAYGVSPSALERAASKAPTNSRLASKLNDLSLVYGAYSSAVEGYGAGDASDDIGKLAKKLSENDFFASVKVYIDSFTSFTASEDEVLYQIIRQSEEVTASLCIPCEEKRGVHFGSIADTLRHFERLAEKCGCETQKLFLNENHRTDDAALRRLSEDIWCFDAKGGDGKEYDTGSVKLIKCTNIYEEAEAVCGEIAKVIRGGMRYRDILILARDASSFEGVIDSALEKAGIPYFMSRTEDVTAMPFSKLLLCALRIYNRGWRTDDVITYLKTGLTGIDERSADVFEQYIWKWSISGGAFIGDDWTMDPDSYSAEVSSRGRAVIEKVNEARRALITPLLRLYAAIDAAKTNVDICRAIFEYMEELSIADKMRSFSSLCIERGDKAGASEALRLYNTVLDVLGILAEFDCGEDRYSSEELEQALRIVLSETGLGVIPTSCDEVTVGSASLMRADSPRCVMLIGVNDGIFPQNVTENRMLSDEDKQFLFENGIELSGGNEERSSEELFYVYRAVSAPSEKLIMTYSASAVQGKNEELRPSLAFERVKHLLGIPVVDYAMLPSIDRLWSENVAFEYAALSAGEVGAALERYFSESEKYRDKLRSLYIPLFDRECRVPGEMADLIFGKNMSFSPSALEKYVGCHFNYWCDYVLRLRPDEKNIFRLSDAGTLVHELLEKFIRAATDENGFNADLAEERLDELVEELMRLYIDENIPGRDAKKERIAHILRKITHLSKLVAKNITSELKRSRFVPSFFELKINETASGAVRPLAFTLEDGARVSLHGTVDRVDLLREGDDVYVKVVDYKTGKKVFSLEDVRRGINLQMLLYLFSICASDSNKTMMGCPEGGELKAAGVVYLSSKLQKVAVNGDASAEKIAEEAEKQLDRSGILLSDERIIDAVNADRDFKYIMSGAKNADSDCFKSSEEFVEIERMIGDTLKEVFTEIRGGNACIEPIDMGGHLPCAYCRMKAVCRMGHIKEVKGDEE